MPDEYFDTQFLHLLEGLNHAVATAGEPMEGNLFYEHHAAEFPRAAIARRFAPKRANLIAACRGRGSLLEIGVNAGHGALLALYHSDIRYVGVDICQHAYTQPSIAFLQKQFPGRVEFFAGDSVVVLPEIVQTRPDLRFDVVHVDGLHTLYHCQQDVSNSLQLTKPFSWIIIDDTDLEDIAAFYEELIANGSLQRKAPEGWQPHYAHTIGMTGA